MKSKHATIRDVQSLDILIAELCQARDRAKSAQCPRLLVRLRLALSSAKGARRNVHTRFRGPTDMHSRLIRIDARFSALCFFRAWRKHLGRRQAYWLTVSRYGWPLSRSLAWSRLDPLARRICAKAA